MMYNPRFKGTNTRYFERICDCRFLHTVNPCRFEYSSKCILGQGYTWITELIILKSFSPRKVISCPEHYSPKMASHEEQIPRWIVETKRNEVLQVTILKVNWLLKVSTTLLGAITDSVGDDQPVRGSYVTYTNISTNNFGYAENYDFETRYAHCR